MKRHIALLRGINISGKNKVPMAELKKCFEAAGFLEVKTWLNSGNVVFSCEEADAAALADRIGRMMQCEFGLDIPVFVILQEELADILRHAPDWWGTENQEIYDNLVFLLPPVTFQEVYHEIGAPKEGLEQIQEYRSAVFWSFSRKEYQKTNWWPKTACADIGSSGKSFVCKRVLPSVRAMPGCAFVSSVWNHVFLSGLLPKETIRI